MIVQPITNRRTKTRKTLRRTFRPPSKPVCACSDWFNVQAHLPPISTVCTDSNACWLSNETGWPVQINCTNNQVDFAEQPDYQQSTCPVVRSPDRLVFIAYLLAISGTFHSLFKVLFIFPSRYLFAIGLWSLFSFRWNLPPTLSCTLKQLDSNNTDRTHIQQTTCSTGFSPSLMLCSKRLSSRRHVLVTRAKTTTRQPQVIADFQFELYPLHSPLLRVS